MKYIFCNIWRIFVYFIENDIYKGRIVINYYMMMIMYLILILWLLLFMTDNQCRLYHYDMTRHDWLLWTVFVVKFCLGNKMRQIQKLALRLSSAMCSSRVNTTTFFSLSYLIIPLQIYAFYPLVLNLILCSFKQISY